MKSTSRRRVTTYELMALIAGLAIGLWLVVPSLRNEFGQGDEFGWFYLLTAFVFGGLSMVGPPLLIWERRRGRRALFGPGRTMCFFARHGVMADVASDRCQSREAWSNRPVDERDLLRLWHPVAGGLYDGGPAGRWLVPKETPTGLGPIVARAIRVGVVTGLGVPWPVCSVHLLPRRISSIASDSPLPTRNLS